MLDDRPRSERRAALAALISAAVMIAQQVGSKATRDALFLSSFAPEDLPRVVIASAAASMVAVLGATRAYARFGPARVVPWAFGVSALLYVAEWVASEPFPRPVAVILYLHTAVFGALVISGFWSVVNERFDPHTAKQVMSRIGTGATFGGVAGGLIAERVGEWSNAETMLLALAAMNGVAAVGVTRIGRALHGHVEEDTTRGALDILRRSPYLRSLAALVLLTAASAALLDYAFKAEAAAHFERGSDLLRFFALFHVGAAVASFLVQTGAGKSALERLGVAGSAATLPAVVMLTALVSAGLTRLATVVVARASELVFANSIFRNGYELLYTPVAPDEKRPTKALIDVAGNRLGDAVGSGLVLAALAVAGALTVKVVLGLAALVALLSLWIARRLHRGYVGQLERSLREGTPAAAEAQILHAATLQTLSTLGLDREALFEQLAAQKSWSDRLSHPSIDGTEETDAKEPDGIDAPDDDPVHAQARVLRHGDADAIRAILDDGPIDPRLVHHVIALLARRDVHQDAIAALRAIASEVVEPLAAALVDVDQPFAIRRRLPRVLEVCADRRCAEGLVKGLDDERFEVKYRCAIALARIAERDRSLRPKPERVHAVVIRELKTTSRKMWDSRRLLDDDSEEDAPLLESALRDRIHRSVEFVFTLLSLAYDPEPLRLSLSALASDDRALRGTALEYLENVLPDDIREALFPMLDVRVEIRRRRPPEEVYQELVRSMQSVDAGELREAIRARSERPPKGD